VLTLDPALVGSYLGIGLVFWAGKRANEGRWVKTRTLAEETNNDCHVWIHL
jgi:hypothetical protein